MKSVKLLKKLNLKHLKLILSNERVNAEIVENAKGKKVGESFSFYF